MSKLPHVAVMNDDPAQLHLITRILESGGFKVSAFADPVDGLTRIGSVPEISLFVVDLHMPRIDGWKVCGLLRSPEFRAFNDVPVLVVSATFSGVDIEQITSSVGAEAFLPSPFRSEDLLRYARDLVGGNVPTRRGRVLIVEDEPSVRQAVAQAFASHGFETFAASTLEQATLLWMDHRPHVIVVDYHLPDGTCGCLLERLHTAGDSAVTLVMTGDPDPILPVTILGLGADRCVHRPFEPGLLVELAAQARRERAVLRIESILDSRTRELQSSKARYASLFDSIPDIILLLDASCRIADANQAASLRLGVDHTALLGQPVGDFVTISEAESGAQVDPGSALQDPSRRSLEAIITSADGIAFPVDIATSYPHGTDSWTIMLVAREATERLRVEQERAELEAQAHHAQRLDSLGVLAGSIAHDFNNLLTGVLGYAGLALAEAPAEGPLRGYVTLIETAAHRAADLANQILTFSGRGRRALQRVDLTDLVSEMGQLLKSAISPGATVSYRLCPTAPSIEGDHSQISQIMMNLIMNASDALKEARGAIEVETSVTRLSEDDLRRHYLGARPRVGTYVSLVVRDDGCGVEPAALSRMFEPFFTTKPHGRGLGLAATLGIVRSHGGLLTVDSVVGGGTEIKVLFPMTAPVAEITDATHNGDGRGWEQKGTVLVVDEDESIRRIANTTLTRSGYSVLEAESGRMGKAIVAEHPEVDAVILDLTMPGESGLDVLVELRRQQPELPVLLSSGYANESVPLHLIRPGTTEFLKKPYRTTELTAAVGDLLRESRPRQPKPLSARDLAARA